LTRDTNTNNDATKLKHNIDISTGE